MKIGNKYEVDCGEDTKWGNNLKMLFDRKKGQKFMVKNGELTIAESFTDRVSYKLFRCYHQKKVKKTISKDLRFLELPKICPGNEGLRREFLEELLFEKMAGMSKRVYNRFDVNDNCEEIIAKELFEKRNDWKQKKHSLASKQAKKAARMAYKIEEVKFALKLGVEFKKLPGGASGSYLGLDRKGKRCVVFKPSDEEPTSGNSPKKWQKIKDFIRKILPFLGGHRCVIPQKGYVAEEAASIIDDWADLNIVPKTLEEEFSSTKFHRMKGSRQVAKGSLLTKKGSCQEFKEGGVPASDVIGISSYLPECFVPAFIKVSKKHTEKAISQDEFEKLVLLDFIQCDLDRHFGNWLIRKQDGSKREKIIAIDNGLSMPFEHPKDYFSRRYLYYWKHMPQAQMKFSQKVKEKVEKLKNDPQCKADLLAKLSTLDLNEDQKKMMQERIEVLIHFVLNDKTPYELGCVKTEEDFKRVLKEIHGENRDSVFS